MAMYEQRKREVRCVWGEMEGLFVEQGVVQVLAIGVCGV
jgi:hypothetical protein